MARTKAVLGAGARLSDYLSASLLARVYPATMIGGILDEHDCNSKRIRSTTPQHHNTNGVRSQYCSVYKNKLNKIKLLNIKNTP